MTGSLALGPAAGVQTFRYRQSSLKFPPSDCRGWGQAGPNAAHSRTWVQARGGCGAFQRSAPMGGAA